jgi:MFS family permease
MAASFPDVQPSQVGLYVGCIGTAFALAQFLTQYFWGWLSDKIGRKPVVLTGTLFTAACFMAFGFCRTLWQAVVVLAAMGLVNGNQGVISTCLGEITDRSNQSKVFVWLPVIYGIGGITGPALGGLLVMERSPFDGGKKAAYPYLLPNLFAAAILLVDLVFTAIFLEESLEEARNLPPLKTRIENLFVWVWQFTGGAIRPTYLRYLGKGQLVHGHHHRVDGSLEYDTDSDISSDIESENQSLLSLPEVFTANRSALSSKHVLNRDTIILLITYLVFQLSNVSFQTLYPVFAFTDPPIGRAISERDIGLSLSAAGVATIIFQVGLFGKLKEKMGNKATYRAGLLLFALSMTAMPFVGYKTGRAPFGWGNPAVWMWGELATILLVRTVASVGGLTSALLLVCLHSMFHFIGVF